MDGNLEIRKVFQVAASEKQSCTIWSVKLVARSECDMHVT